MRMTNTPADYQLNTPATALDFINQAQAWLEEAAVTAARVAASAVEEAEVAQRKAAQADRLVDAFTSVSSSVSADTIAAVTAAAKTLRIAAAVKRDRATVATAEAEAFAAAVLTAKNLPAIDTWEGIK